MNLLINNVPLSIAALDFQFDALSAHCALRSPLCDLRSTLRNSVLRSALCALPLRLWLRPQALLRAGQNRPPFASHGIYHTTPWYIPWHGMPMLGGFPPRGPGAALCGARQALLPG